MAHSGTGGRNNRRQSRVSFGRGRGAGRGQPPNGSNPQPDGRTDGEIINKIVRGNSPIPTLPIEWQPIASKLAATPLNDPIDFKPLMRLRVPPYEKTCIMLSIAASRASSRTGVDVTKCHIFWHNRMIDFFTKLANDVSYSKEACDKLSLIKSPDFDCMYLSVIDAPAIHYRPVIAQITTAVATDEQYLEAIEKFCKRYMAHHWLDFMTALESPRNKPQSAKLYQLCVTKGALFMQARIMGVDIEFTPPRIHIIPPQTPAPPYDEDSEKDTASFSGGEINYPLGDDHPQDSSAATVQPWTTPAFELGYTEDGDIPKLMATYPDSSSKHLGLLSLIENYLTMYHPSITTPAMLVIRNREKYPLPTVVTFFGVAGALRTGLENAGIIQPAQPQSALPTNPIQQPLLPEKSDQVLPSSATSTNNNHADASDTSEATTLTSNVLPNDNQSTTTSILAVMDGTKTPPHSPPTEVSGTVANSHSPRSTDSNAAALESTPIHGNLLHDLTSGNNTSIGSKNPSQSISPSPIPESYMSASPPGERAPHFDRLQHSTYPSFGERITPHQGVLSSSPRVGWYLIGFSTIGPDPPHVAASQWAAHITQTMTHVKCGIAFPIDNTTLPDHFTSPSTIPVTEDDWGDRILQPRQSTRRDGYYFELVVVSDFSLDTLAHAPLVISHTTDGEDQVTINHQQWLSTMCIRETIITYRLHDHTAIAMVANSSLADGMSNVKKEYIKRLAEESQILHANDFDIAWETRQNGAECIDIIVIYARTAVAEAVEIQILILTEAPKLAFRYTWNHVIYATRRFNIPSQLTKAANHQRTFMASRLQVQFEGISLQSYKATPPRLGSRELHSAISSPYQNFFLQLQT